MTTVDHLGVLLGLWNREELMVQFPWQPELALRASDVQTSFGLRDATKSDVMMIQIPDIFK